MQLRWSRYIIDGLIEDTPERQPLQANWPHDLPQGTLHFVPCNVPYTQNRKLHQIIRLLLSFLHPIPHAPRRVRLDLQVNVHLPRTTLQTPLEVSSNCRVHTYHD